MNQSTEEVKKTMLGDEKMDNVALNIIGWRHRHRENMVIPRLFGPPEIKTNEEKMLQRIGESCPFKACLSGVIGKLEISLWT